MWHTMSREHSISIIAVADKHADLNKNDSNVEDRKEKPADFEAAIAAAGHGKFQYLLLLAIIPVSWGTSIDTSSVALIVPSAGCDLQMTFFQKGVLTAVIYVGMVSSGFLWGYIADVRGRRPVLLYGILADGICNVLSGLSQNFWTLVFFKLLSGFIISGPHASLVTYTSEFYGVKGRVKIPLLVGFSTSFGNIVAAVLAWIIIPQRWSITLFHDSFIYNSWRMFLSVCGIPMLIGTVCLPLFPESPKFLMSQGRTEDALKVFKTIYRVNTGKPAEEYPFKMQHLENKCSNKGSRDDASNGKIEKKAIFFYPHLPMIFLVMAMQFGSMYATNTIRLWQPQLFTILDNFNPSNYNLTTQHRSTFCEVLDLSSVANKTTATALKDVTCANLVVNESVYINTIIISAFGCVLLLSASILLNFLNHKHLLHACYGVAFTCIVCLYWSNDSLITLLLTSLYFGLTNTTLNTIVAATVVLFPTSLRAIAVSLVMVMGRIGSIIGNILFPVLLAQGCLAPMIQLACFVLLCIMLTCFLPLTKRKAKK